MSSIHYFQSSYINSCCKVCTKIKLEMNVVECVLSCDIKTTFCEFTIHITLQNTIKRCKRKLIKLEMSFLVKIMIFHCKFSIWNFHSKYKKSQKVSSKNFALNFFDWFSKKRHQNSTQQYYFCYFSCRERNVTG